MFDEYTQIQPVADRLNKLIHRLGMTPTRRKPILDSLKRFERAAWHPAVWQQALEAIAPVRLNLQGDELRFDLSRADVNAPAALHYLIEKYIELISGERRVFGTNEAAEHMGLTTRTMKYYIHGRGEGEPGQWQPKNKVSGRYVLSLEEVYQFDGSRKKPGPVAEKA